MTRFGKGKYLKMVDSVRLVECCNLPRNLMKQTCVSYAKSQQPKAARSCFIAHSIAWSYGPIHSPDPHHRAMSRCCSAGRWQAGCGKAMGIWVSYSQGSSPKPGFNTLQLLCCLFFSVFGMKFMKIFADICRLDPFGNSTWLWTIDDHCLYLFLLYCIHMAMGNCHQSSTLTILPIYIYVYIYVYIYIHIHGLYM